MTQPYTRRGGLGAIARLFSGWIGEITALAAGGIGVLAFAPFGLWPLAVLSPAVLIFLWIGVTPRRALVRGIFYGAAEFLVGIYWVYIAVTVIGGAPVWLGALLYIGLALACAVFPGALGYGALRLQSHPGGVWLLFIPPAWAVLEWVRSFLFTGFPWLALGFSQVDSPLAGYAPVAGVYGVSLAVMAVAMFLVYGLVARAGLAARALAFGGIGVLLVVGAVLTGHGWTRFSGPAFRVSLIQGNVPQTLKWSPRMLLPTLERYAQLTRAHWTSRLIVWPESAVPIWSREAMPLLTPLFQAARAHGTTLALGIPVYDAARNAGYNALLGVSPRGGFSTYYKRHLVPFGEYFPVPGRLKRWLKAHALPYSSFTPGAADQPALRLGRWKAAIALCYEIAFGRLLIRQLPAAEFIVNASDDGWFGHSIALPQQFQMARLAALETGRFVLVTADDGITGIVDPRGEVRGRLPPYREGVLSGMIRPRTGATPFVRFGNYLVVILSLVLIGLAVVSAWIPRWYSR